MDKSEFLKQILLTLLPSAESRKTAISGFSIYRYDSETENRRCFYKPSIILLLQGRKKVLVGSKEFVYGENQCMITGIDLPTAAKIIDASKERPALGVTLEFDIPLLTELAAKITMPAGTLSEKFSYAITQPDAAIIDAFLRLTELLEKPEQQTILAPMIIREIHYLLLVGPYGNQLKQIFSAGTKSNGIAHSIAWLKAHYTLPLNVDRLAERVNMARSTFHRQFKYMTSISPLQYQKKLRLMEAQRLMLIEKRDAASAGYEVGYESPTQFSREYKRMFGEPPKRDLQRIIG